MMIDYVSQWKRGGDMSIKTLQRELVKKDEIIIQLVEDRNTLILRNNNLVHCVEELRKFAKRDRDLIEGLKETLCIQ